MKFTAILATASAALVSVVAAQENPFHEPIASSVLVAGKSFNITWGPTTKGTVSLLLKKGLANDLSTVGTIATDIANSGSYSWTVPADTVTGNDYALEITDAAKDINYTPQFVIQGVPASYSASSASSSASSTSEFATASTSTVVSTKSILSTSVIATQSVYGSHSISTTVKPTFTAPAIIYTAGTGSAGVPVHTNGTIAISTLKPTGGESTKTSASGSKTSTTALSTPSPSSPSAANSVQVALSMMAGAFLIALLSLL